MPNNANETPNNNPVIQEALKEIPESLHHLVSPVLQKWDQNFQQKLQAEIAKNQGLNAYKAFADNKIQPQAIESALKLAGALQQDPKGTIAQINKAWDLGFVPQDEVQKLQQSDPEDELFGNDGEVDITKHPQFQAMLQTVNQMQQTFNQRQKEEAEQAEVDAFEEELDELEEKYKEGGFDRTLVSAYMLAGMEGDEAVKSYRDHVAKLLQNSGVVPDNQSSNNPAQQPPVVMGGDGAAGSGVPQNQIDLAGMSNGDVTDLVANMLQAQAQQNNQG